MINIILLELAPVLSLSSNSRCCSHDDLCYPFHAKPKHLHSAWNSYSLLSFATIMNSNHLALTLNITSTGKLSQGSLLTVALVPYSLSHYTFSLFIALILLECLLFSVPLIYCRLNPQWDCVSSLTIVVLIIKYKKYYRCFLFGFFVLNLSTEILVNHIYGS